MGVTTPKALVNVPLGSQKSRYFVSGATDVVDQSTTPVSLDSDLSRLCHGCDVSVRVVAFGLVVKYTRPWCIDTVPLNTSLSCQMENV